MSVGTVLLSEKTRVSINISTLLFVIGYSIIGTFTFTTYKTEFEMRLNAQETGLIEETEERKSIDLEIKEELKETTSVLVESNTKLAEMQTDLKWIRAYMEKDQ